MADKAWTAVNGEGNSVTYEGGEVVGAHVDGKTYGRSPVKSVKTKKVEKEDKR